MRTWIRVPASTFCGNCCAQIEKGELMQAIQLKGVKHPKWRCTKCADGEPPPQVWPRVEPTQTGLGFSKFKNPTNLEREPGIEG
jgi:hypothetical protein